MMTPLRHFYFTCACVQWGYTDAASAGENSYTVEKCLLREDTPNLFFSNTNYSLLSQKEHERRLMLAQVTKEILKITFHA